VEEWIACDSPPLSSETQFSDIERRDGYVLPHLNVAPSDAFTIDFSFVNLTKHKVEEIIGFYGGREHKGRSQSLVGKRWLNRIFDAVGLCYADRAGPSTSLLDDDVAPRGHGSRGCGHRGRARKVTARCGANTAILESRKRQRVRRGRGFTKPADVCIGREMAGRVGN
jgi:hypothetical protein